LLTDKFKLSLMDLRLFGTVLGINALQGGERFF